MQYKIGADPELFMVDLRTNMYESAHNYIMGDKHTPFLVTDGATQKDGVSAEFNILPCTSVDEFVSRIKSVQKDMYKQIHSVKDGKHFMLVADPVATFEQTYFDKLPDDVKALGCMPDYNAYTGKENDPPATLEPFRTGSGHVHVGYNMSSYDENEVKNRVKQLDYTLFPISLLWDDNHKRRELYGMPGAFRYKPYGFEYRVLSNSWVGSERLQRWVYEATIRSMTLFDQGELLFSSEPPDLNYTKEELVEYHDNLVDLYEFPSLGI